MSEGDDRNPYAEAEKRGCHVVLPQPNELFVDIDDKESFTLFLKTLEILNRGRGVQWTYRMTPSPSGKPDRYHVTVTMDAELQDERVRLGLQAILGSDRKREALCWLRHEQLDEVVTCFFEKDVEAAQ